MGQKRNAPISSSEHLCLRKKIVIHNSLRKSADVLHVHIKIWFNKADGTSGGEKVMCQCPQSSLIPFLTFLAFGRKMLYLCNSGAGLPLRKVPLRCLF